MRHPINIGRIVLDLATDTDAEEVSVSARFRMAAGLPDPDELAALACLDAALVALGRAAARRPTLDAYLGMAKIHAEGAREALEEAIK